MPNGSGPQLASAPTHMKPALRLLLTDYLVEFAAIERKVPTRDANGHVPYKYFDQYWVEAERFPFGIWLENKLVGFCLLRDTGEQWQERSSSLCPTSVEKESVLLP